MAWGPFPRSHCHSRQLVKLSVTGATTKLRTECNVDRFTLGVAECSSALALSCASLNVSGSLRVRPGPRPVAYVFINANAGEATGACRDGEGGRDGCVPWASSCALM